MALPSVSRLWFSRSTPLAFSGAARLSAVLVAGLLAATSGVTACSSDDDGGGSSSSSGKPGTCEADARKDVYAAGLTKKASSLTVALLASSPSPPAKSMNAFTLRITDAGGAPVDGATVAVTPYMPDHAHGTNVVPEVAAKGDGTYEVSKIYLVMPGFWRITVTVTTPGAAPQEVAFSFCVEG